MKDVFLVYSGSPLKKKKSHPETIYRFTYARLRQMLNNSSTAADNTQLYLGYGGAWVLSPCLRWNSCSPNYRHYFAGRAGQSKTRALCIKEPDREAQ